VVALIVGGLVWAGLPSTTTTTTTTPLSTANFSVTVTDGITGGERNLTGWNLYNTTDPDVWAEYTSMATGTAEELITRAQINTVLGWLDGTEEGLYLYATAANNISMPHDSCAYLPAWILLNPYGANELKFYATPMSTVRTLTYENGTQFTSKNFSANNNYFDPAFGAGVQVAYKVANFSATIGINASDIGYAGYHGIFDPLAAAGPAMTGVYLVVNFNVTVTNADLFIRNQYQASGSAYWMQAAKLNATALAFYTADMNGRTLIDFEWKQDSSVLIKGVSVELVYGTWYEAAAHSGTSLAVLV
jgi:hypothetical protein